MSDWFAAATWPDEGDIDCVETDGDIAIDNVGADKNAEAEDDDNATPEDDNNANPSSLDDIDANACVGIEAKAEVGVEEFSRSFSKDRLRFSVSR